MEPHELRLRRWNEPDVVVFVAVEVLVEVRQVRASGERLATCDERRVDLGEASFDLEVDHPRDERALEGRARSAQHVETRARELRTARDVEDAECLADFPVGTRREIELLRVV